MTETINRKLLRDIPKILVSLGMSISTYQPQAVNIGFMYNVILDGRIIGYIPETLTEFFIKKLRMLKVQGNQVNTIYTYAHVYTDNYQNCILNQKLLLH